MWRLTDKGRDQALAAGAWLAKEGLQEFDRYYVSEYLRAMETAARLDLPASQWFTEMLLRERDWGSMDLMSEEERVNLLSDELQRLELDPFYYAPPSGESMADVAQRIDRLIEALHRDCAGKRVILVCHSGRSWI